VLTTAWGCNSSLTVIASSSVAPIIRVRVGICIMQRLIEWLRSMQCNRVGACGNCEFTFNMSSSVPPVIMVRVGICVME